MFSVSFVVVACQRRILLHQKGDRSLDTSFGRQDSSPDFESPLGPTQLPTELVPRGLFVEVRLVSYLLHGAESFRRS
jgi:hypothetical protein